MVPVNRSTIASSANPRTTQSYWWKRGLFAGFLIGFCFFSIVDQQSTVSKYTRYAIGESTAMAFQAANIGGRTDGISSKTFVVTTTFYPDLSDIR